MSGASEEEGACELLAYHCEGASYLRRRAFCREDGCLTSVPVFTDLKTGEVAQTGRGRVRADAEPEDEARDEHGPPAVRESRPYARKGRNCKQMLEHSGVEGGDQMNVLAQAANIVPRRPKALFIGAVSPVGSS